MLSCRDVVQLLGTDAIGQASLRQRVAVRLHLMMCRHCRAYQRSLRRLASLARQMIPEAAVAADRRAQEVLAAVTTAAGRAANTPDG